MHFWDSFSSMERNWEIRAEVDEEVRAAFAATRSKSAGALLAVLAGAGEAASSDMMSGG